MMIEAIAFVKFSKTGYRMEIAIIVREIISGMESNAFYALQILICIKVREPAPYVLKG
jgi:hypothetical protein